MATATGALALLAEDWAGRIVLAAAAGALLAADFCGGVFAATTAGAFLAEDGSMVANVAGAFRVDDFSGAMAATVAGDVPFEAFPGAMAATAAGVCVAEGFSGAMVADGVVVAAIAVAFRAEDWPGGMVAGPTGAFLEGISSGCFRVCTTSVTALLLIQRSLSKIRSSTFLSLVLTATASAAS